VKAMDELQDFVSEAHKNAETEVSSHVLRNNKLRSKFHKHELLFAGLHFSVNCFKLCSMCLIK
jgi:hypothetical protein